MAAAQVEAARAGEKARRKLELELAAYQGQGAVRGHGAGRGWRAAASARRTRSGNLEELRAVAQNFTAQAKGGVSGDAGGPAFGAAGGVRPIRAWMRASW